MKTYSAEAGTERKMHSMIGSLCVTREMRSMSSINRVLRVPLDPYRFGGSPSKKGEKD